MVACMIPLRALLLSKSKVPSNSRVTKTIMKTGGTKSMKFHIEEK